TPDNILLRIFTLKKEHRIIVHSNTLSTENSQTKWEENTSAFVQKINLSLLILGQLLGHFLP
ncbi:MAG: hypothetical protein ACKVK9_09720, partial [Nitrospinaceae bacterium]